MPVEHARSAHIDVEWGPDSDVPSGVIQDTIGNALDHLMAQLVCMGVTDPDISATLAGRRIADSDPNETEVQP